MPKDFDEVNLVKIFTFEISVGRIYAMSNIVSHSAKVPSTVGFNNINKQEREKKVFQTDEDHKNRVKPNETAMNAIALLECVYGLNSTHAYIANRIKYRLHFYPRTLRKLCDLLSVSFTHSHSCTPTRINNQRITTKTKPKLYLINSTKVAVQCAMCILEVLTWHK